MNISPALLPLRARFMEVNLGRAQALSKHQIDLLTEDFAHEALLASGSIAHQICGVAQTLGFEAMGELAFDLDQTISAYRNRQIDYQQAWIQAEPLIEDLIVTIESTDP